MEEQLSGACTVEIAAFDEFSELLGDAASHGRLRPRHLRHRADRPHPAAAATARRLDRLHRARNTTGTSCLGPLAGLDDAAGALRRARWTRSPIRRGRRSCWSAAPRPPRCARPSARARARRARRRATSASIVNGVFARRDPATRWPWRSRPRGRGRPRRRMPAALAALPRTSVPLLPVRPRRHRRAAAPATSREARAAMPQRLHAATAPRRRTGLAAWSTSSRAAAAASS